jgi:hypothetical protein
VLDKVEGTSNKATSKRSGDSSTSSSSSSSSRKQNRREMEVYEGAVLGVGRTGTGTLVRIDQLPDGCMRDASTTGSNTVSVFFQT